METMDQEAVSKANALNPFAPAGGPIGAAHVAASTSQAREIAEVQALMIIAKRFPRDQLAAMDRILNACTRPTLADDALYEYSKGGSNVSGPSIRLAEVLAQNWGNIQTGVRELEQRPGESTVEAFAMDTETGFRDSKVFQVPHIRYLGPKNGKPAKTYRLEDPREIYEHVANLAARRKRACILATIPGDVVEAAVEQCEKTLLLKAKVTPDRLKEIAEAFDQFGVTTAAIEKRIQRRFDAMTPGQMVGLHKIITSLRDAMSKPSDWFDLEPTPEGGAPADPVATKGAAALKAGAEKAAGKASLKGGKKQEVPTYAEIGDAINKAKGIDTVDQALSLIHDGLPDEQQIELRDLGKARRLEIEDVS